MIGHEGIRFDDADWASRMAKLEDKSASVSVGGLASDAELCSAASPQNAMERIAREALAIFIKLTRRDLGLTAEEFAKRANMALVDILRLECGDPFAMDRCAVAQLASVLSVPECKLKELSGLTQSLDVSTQRAAMRLAEWAEPFQCLSNEERVALRDFVEELSSGTK